MPNEKDTYICEVCKETFIKGQSDEEANKEAEELWGVKNASENQNMGVVCDDCYNMMMGQDKDAQINLKKSNLLNLFN